MGCFAHHTLVYACNLILCSSRRCRPSDVSDPFQYECPQNICICFTELLTEHYRYCSIMTKKLRELRTRRDILTIAKSFLTLPANRRISTASNAQRSAISWLRRALKAFSITLVTPSYDNIKANIDRCSFESYSFSLIRTIHFRNSVYKTVFLWPSVFNLCRLQIVSCNHHADCLDENGFTANGLTVL